MKKLFLFIILILLVPRYLSGQYSLEIEITGIKSNEGVIMLQLFDGNQKEAGHEKGIIKENKCVIIFKDLKPGKYAFRYFHDENLSGVMETNPMGIPTEGYGFSNNATGMFGPPSFDKWIFELKNNMKLIVKITS